LHLTLVPFVIVAQEMQQSMKGQDPQFDAHRVAIPGRLSPGQGSGNRDIA
jgi:hypothetical protein